jgi:hypothetical protein
MIYSLSVKQTGRFGVSLTDPSMSGGHVAAAELVERQRPH